MSDCSILEWRVTEPTPVIRPTLLLIDDDSMVGRFIGHAAEECGCNATRTTCIESFTNAFRRAPPDIVAVDLCIPGHDGIELIRFLAEEKFQGMVLVISGLDRRVRDAALRLGEALGLRMAEPLAKPFKVAELADRLMLETSEPALMTVPAGEAAIGSALQFAAERGELFMLYQPKISLATGEMVGVEALMRWQSPELGLIYPASFIPIAERSGIIDELSEWAMRSILKQWLGWQEQGVKTNVAFNISALTLRDVYFPDYLQRLCQGAGVPCDYLTVEVTESATQHAIRLLDTITRFRIKGLAVEIDDFGTGYSSLLQLRQLPYTGLKVDICFVRDILREIDARVIVKSIIDLAHGLGLIATAEGVEDRETLALLREMGCDHAQGFLISDPLKAAELAPWVLRSASRWREDFKPSVVPMERARKPSLAYAD